MSKSTMAILFSTMAVNACTLTASGTGTATTETRDLPAFSSVSLNGVSKVRIHKGPQAVLVTIDENLLERYETKVKNGKLTMGFKCGIGTLLALRSLKTCEVDITMPQLDGIVLNGAGTMSVDELDYDDLTLVVNGAGTVELTGSAASLDVTCTGSCKILASECAAAAGRISITGAGHVEARVADSLIASVTGAGELLYWGNPTVSQKISGAGSVRRAGE